MATANDSSTFGHNPTAPAAPSVAPQPESQDADVKSSKHAAIMVHPDSEVRKLLKNKRASSLTKYMWLVIGRDSISGLIRYELLTGLLGGLPGALGFFLRQKLYRSLFRSCGKGVVIGRNVTIRHPHKIELGDNVVLDDNSVLDAKGDGTTAINIGSNSILGRNSLLVCKGGTIELGEDVNISVNCTIISESELVIGKKTLVGGHCYIIAGGNHGTDCSGEPFVDQPRLLKGGVHILENCWLGASVTMLDGVTVGPHTIVGASAMVHRTMPSNCVVGGVPAEVISEGGRSDAPAGS